MELITGENDKNRRLDRILRKALPDHPLPLIHRLLRRGQVFVNEKPAKAQDRLDCGAKISIPSIKDTPKPAAVPSLPSPDIIWESPGLIAVNKPAGLEVHGNNSLDEMVRSFLSDKIAPSLSFKPGPLHRLDRPSSGIVVFSTSIEGARLFSSLMRERKIKKTYLAIVEGKIKNEEIWEDDLVRDKEMKKTFIAQKGGAAGKPAITKIKPVAEKDGCTLIRAEIATGRTHQIRAQAAAHGHPLIGDKKYGGLGGRRGGIFLHAWKLEFEHPQAEAFGCSIEAPPPERFEKMMATFIR